MVRPPILPLVSIPEVGKTPGQGKAAQSGVAIQEESHGSAACGLLTPASPCPLVLNGPTGMPSLL